MFELKIPTDNLPDRLEKIYKTAEGCALDPAILSGLEADIQCMADFWHCSKEEAFLLSLMTYKAMTGGSISIKSVVDHLELGFSYAISFNELLKPIVARDWIAPKKDIQLQPMCDYMMNHRLVKSVLSGTLQMEEESDLVDQFFLLNKFQRLFAKRKERQLNFEQLQEAAEKLFTDHAQLDWVKFMGKEALDTKNKLLYVLFCNGFYHDSINYDTDDLLNNLLPNKHEAYTLKNDFRTGKLQLIQKGIIKESKADLFLGNIQFQLTEKGLAGFDSNAVLPDQNKQGLLHRTNPEQIQKSQLIFNRDTDKQIKKLQDILSEVQFPELITRLQQQGMKPGVSILLHGAPGTGKTESVYQLAKSSNRIILSADASTIRSKWIGDTEKNIRALFNEYKTTRSQSLQTPILLFNEADGIFGRRLAIKDRGDQMENTLQNILLEELENFEGIFIATTNMSDNFDKAFDRRFLYKIKFDKPGTIAIRKIWKDKFPDLSAGTIKKLAESYRLSGAQIENIRKKTAVDAILNGALKINYTYLQELISQELALELQKHHSNPIGFNPQRKTTHHEYR